LRLRFGITRELVDDFRCGGHTHDCCRDDDRGRDDDGG
jgi:hypothetical protein